MKTEMELESDALLEGTGKKQTRDSLSVTANDKPMLESGNESISPPQSKGSEASSPIQSMKLDMEQLAIGLDAVPGEDEIVTPQQFSDKVTQSDSTIIIYDKEPRVTNDDGKQSGRMGNSILKAGGGGGDADVGIITDSPRAKVSVPMQVGSRFVPSVQAKSSGTTESAIPASTSASSTSDLNRQQKRVCFSDSVLSLKSCESSNEIKNKKSICIVENSGRKALKSFPRFSRSKKTAGKLNCPLPPNTEFRKTEVSKTPTPNLPSQVPETNLPIPISSKHETMKLLAASLSSKSIKSKMLESKFQQTIRLSFFDYEAQRASEEWKFRKSIETLDLEYQRKFLNLMEGHNKCQQVLRQKFIKQVKKTEKKLKKVALQGHLNEGSCFSVSHNICGFKINKY